MVEKAKLAEIQAKGLAKTAAEAEELDKEEAEEKEKEKPEMGVVTVGVDVEAKKEGTKEGRKYRASEGAAVTVAVVGVEVYVATTDTEVVATSEAAYTVAHQRTPHPHPRRASRSQRHPSH